MKGRDHLANLVKRVKENSDPNELPELLTELAGWTFECAREEAREHGRYILAERTRKAKCAEVKLEKMAQGSSATKADAELEADARVKEAWRDEIGAQAERLELKALLDGARDVMDAARSKLSWLKAEMQHG